MMYSIQDVIICHLKLDNLPYQLHIRRTGVLEDTLPGINRSVLPVLTHHFLQVTGHCSFLSCKCLF